MFPGLETSLKSYNFESLEDIPSSITTLLKEVWENYLNSVSRHGMHE